MSDKQLYYPIWHRHLPVIALQMKNATNGTKAITMYKTNFEILGNRRLSDYSISLEIKNGKVLNNISTSAVAKDLVEVLLSDKPCKTMLANQYYKFEMGKDFVLQISIM